MVPRHPASLLESLDQTLGTTDIVKLQKSSLLKIYNC